MEEFYPEPDDNLKKRRFIEYKTTFIDPLFPKDKSIRIADLGCGYGLFLDTCRRLGYLNYEGVELLEKFVNYANKELGLKTVARDDIFHFLESKSDEYYDVVTALNTVEHVKKDKVQYLLNLINKKLKGKIFNKFYKKKIKTGWHVCHGSSKCGQPSRYSYIFYRFNPRIRF